MAATDHQLFSPTEFLFLRHTSSYFCEKVLLRSVCRVTVQPCLSWSDLKPDLYRQQGNSVLSVRLHRVIYTHFMRLDISKQSPDGTNLILD